MTPWQRLPPRKRRAIALDLADSYGWICHLCKQPIDPYAHEWAQRLSVDHLVPQSHGGSNDIENLAPAHMGCNASRGAQALSSDAPIVDNLTDFSG